MTKVLFVCLGNIMRSPAGEEIFRQKALSTGFSPFTVASCGTGDWHTGELPHKTMRQKARERGYDLQSRAQTFHPVFFEEYDYILVADRKILSEVLALASDDVARGKVSLISAFSEKFFEHDIPDPYFAGEEAFHHALDILEDACDGLLMHLQKKPD